MAVTYPAALKNNRLNLVVNSIGTGSSPTISNTGTAAGTLVIGTTSMATTLATFTLDITPATVSNSVLTFTNGGSALSTSNFKTATASNTGTAALAQIKNNAGTVIIDGLTVGTSGTDIIINTTSITSGQMVNWTAGTITHG